jgi:hypothetical protein
MKTEENKYRVVSSKFIGFNDYGNGTGSYTYEITFNKSLEHTGKFTGIENGLNRYDKKEPWKELLNSIRRAYYMFLLGIQRIF